MQKSYEKADHFVADEDIVESLKSEASAVSPETQGKLEELAKDVANDILQEYGSHMSDAAKERVENLPKRVLVLEEADFSETLRAWLPKRQHVGDNAAGTYVLMGDFIVLSNERTDLEHRVSNFLSAYPEADKEIARQVILKMSLIKSLAHEIVHAHQDSKDTTEHDDLRAYYSRLAFDECGVAFITEEICNKMFPERLNISYHREEERRDYFKHLKDKYGEEIYDILFVKVPQNDEASYLEREAGILSEFPHEKKKDLGIY